MDEKKLEEFMKRRVAERVIKGYLAIKKVKEEKNYGNEYIKMKYKINAAKYEILYNVLEEDIKAECEAEKTVDKNKGLLCVEFRTMQQNHISQN